MSKSMQSSGPIADVQNKFGTITIKKEEVSIDMSRSASPNQPANNHHIHHEFNSNKRENLASPSPTPSTISSNGSSITSSAISLSMKKSNCDKNSTSLTIASLQHEHQQLQQRHQQNFLSRLRQHRQQNYDDDQTKQHHQQCFDDLQTHHQMTANLFMARTIALSTSREFDLLHQSTTNDSPTLSTNSTTAAVSGNFLLPCPLCETPLEPRLFRQHLDRHYPRDSPVCPVLQCGRRFAHPNSVRNHMRIKHTIQWTKMKAMRSSGGPFTGIPDYK